MIRWKFLVSRSALMFCFVFDCFINRMRLTPILVTGLGHRPQISDRIGRALLLIQVELTSPLNAIRTPLIWMLPPNNAPEPMPLIHTHSIFSTVITRRIPPQFHHHPKPSPTVSHPSKDPSNPASTSSSHSTAPAPVSLKASAYQLALYLRALNLLTSSLASPVPSFDTSP